jgi:hypothetical protein
MEENKEQATPEVAAEEKKEGADTAGEQAQPEGSATPEGQAEGEAAPEGEEKNPGVDRRGAGSEGESA